MPDLQLVEALQECRKSCAEIEATDLQPGATTAAGFEIAGRLDRLLDELQPVILESNATDRARFGVVMQQTWGAPLHGLELLIDVCQVTTGLQYESSATAARETGDEKVAGMSYLKPRGIRVAREVLALCWAGFADAAVARWRTLHEISCVVRFLSERDADISKRFRLHQDIDAYKEALDLSRHGAALGFTPIREDSLAELKSRRDELVKTYGKSFGYDWGWATEALGLSENARPTFAQIEAAVNFDRFRPYVRLSSHAVHGGSSGAYRTLGLPHSDEDQLLLGASYLGIGDPGQLTAISLAQVAAAPVLGLGHANLFDVVAMLAVNERTNKVVQAFASAEPA